MPELPEVETIRRQLEIELKGFTFVSITTDNEKMFRPSFKAVSKAIVGQKIKAIDRQAKLIIFNLTSDKKQLTNDGQKSGVSCQGSAIYLLFHLKLTGRLLVRKTDAPADDFVHAVFTLDPIRIPDLRPSDPGSKLELRFADARKFGFVKLITNKKEMEELLAGYGPEPFKDLNLKNFTGILESSGWPVKVVLLDQEKISGIGNIYANDALYLSKIYPIKPANKLASGEVMRLYKSILVVLKRGLKYGGASDQWYRQVHGEEGKYQEHFLVYGKVDQPCKKCGDIIKRIVVGGRGTFFCPTCQLVCPQKGRRKDEC